MSTSIEWTDATWNPVTGCTKGSAGCKNCYAETIANRRLPQGGFTDRPFTEVRCHPERLDAPLHWRKPLKVFVNSMSDLFHEDVTDEFIESVFAVMALAPRHTFQILTKRPERMLSWFTTMGGLEDRKTCVERAIGHRTGNIFERITWPLPNVVLMVSAEDQPRADERVPLLLQTPAAVRGVSYEPALGPVNFSRFLRGGKTHHMQMSVSGALRNKSFDALQNDSGRELSRERAEFELERLHAAGVKVIRASKDCVGFNDQTGCPGHDHPRLDWIVVGGESGPGARPFDVEWARNTITQCREAGVACFVKQLGRNPWGRDVLGRPTVPEISDSKGGDPSEWPEDLRVREWPR